MKIKVFLLLLLLEGVSIACDVPVFRYALERWERDLYKVFILHRGELSAADSSLAEKIYESAIVNGGHTNFVNYRVDLNDPKAATNFFKSYPKLKEIAVSDKPMMTLLYPNITRVDDPIWTGAMNSENIEELVNAEATSALMKGVLQGYSTTFLLMESGDKEKDDKAAEEVNLAIEKLKKEISVPEGVVKADGEVTGGKLTAYEAATLDPSNVLKSGIPLKIDFHLVRMPNNQSNPIFRAILDKTFKDGSEGSEPKLFAFFGRGRLLGPMIGEEIIVKHIIQLSTYICSACSCQVKRQNPGVDFLTNLNWTSYLEGSEVVIDKELPPLIGMIDVAPQKIVELTDESMPIVKASENEKSSPIMRNTLVALGGLFVLIIGGSFMLRKNG